MADIPEDIMQAASTVYAECLQSGFTAGSIKVLAKAILAERERCARVARAYSDTYRKGLVHYGSADKDGGRGRQEGHIKAGLDIAGIIEVFEDPAPKGGA